ncbi:bifunctional 3-deoxy-7-phosphoheptulonate synthase/chorismate mutase [Chloroflexi bacterium TSY]|nr:bifunctional 3-deoxy-7-phosphoheptulonate synthase/chorismate mutase [Chloroflexi bacterium TSY]
MSQSQIQDLRQRIDGLNLEILKLLSQRGKIASEIGHTQTSTGLSQYDPKRELEMLQALTHANDGPFDDATIKSLFKNIFQASMVTSQAAEKPKFLHSREGREDTVVMIGDIPIGRGHPPALIAGPCAIESQEQVEVTADHVASHGIKLFRGGAFKPRSNPYSFQGLGEPALQWGRAACDKHGMSFVAEIMDARDLELCLDYVDVLQIGARNSQNFTLLKAVGRTDRPIFLKRALSGTIEEWIMSAEYIMSEGNTNVVLCERGIRTYEQYTRNTLDVSAVALAKLETHLPVFVDATHSGGRRDLLVPLTKAGLAAGADGVMVEVHPNPAVALSDQKQQMDFDFFDNYLEAVGYDKQLSAARHEVYGF